WPASQVRCPSGPRWASLRVARSRASARICPCAEYSATIPHIVLPLSWPASRCRAVTFATSDLGLAAIDEQLDAGDVTAVVRGEEHGGIRHLVRRADPAHRHAGDEARLELVALLPRRPALLEDGRLDRAGADDVDANPAVPEVGGPAARERTHRGL